MFWLKLLLTHQAFHLNTSERSKAELHSRSVALRQSMSRDSEVK